MRPDADHNRLFTGRLALLALSILGNSQMAAGQGTDAKDAKTDYAALREKLVVEDIAAAGISNPRVLAAMRSTPRHEFVPAGFRQYAYADAGLPIGDQQTISPPYVVAYMTQQLDPQPDDRVLEIGTGSGYQAAILSGLVREVFTIEIVERLGRRAEQTLQRLGYKNVSVRIGDGFKGWPEKAPFDKIIVTCSPEQVPQPLVDQLREGGQMIIPVGERYQQNLYRVTKRNGELVREPLQATLFVPMTGQAEVSRVVQPDPLHPTVHNGGFEQVVEKTDQPVGWHYLRQAKSTATKDAPEGSRVLSLANDEPGRSCHALQGFAVDGKKIGRLNVSCSIRGENLVTGPTPEAQAALIVTFYDDRRAAIANEQLGPWSGTFPWRREIRVLPVPLAAREAIVRIELNGGTGKLETDDLQVTAKEP